MGVGGWDVFVIYWDYCDMGNAANFMCFLLTMLAREEA